MTVSVKNILDLINNSILNIDTNDLDIKCIVKKIVLYNTIYFLDLVDISDSKSVINACLFKSYFYQEIKVNDIIIVNGYLKFMSKQVTFNISRYEICQNNIKTDYEKILNNLRNKYDIYHKINIPLYISKIVIISSVNALGLKDILDVLKCKIGPKEIYIVPCILQGNKMEKNVITALKKAIDYSPDIICIVRGGGAKHDLDWFNNYEIAETILLLREKYNIPFLTGIGHETDITTTDVVSDKSFNTPTQVGYFILNINDKIHEKLNIMKKIYNKKIYSLLDIYHERQNENIIIKLLLKKYNEIIYNNLISKYSIVINKIFIIKKTILNILNEKIKDLLYNKISEHCSNIKIIKNRQIINSSTMIKVNDIITIIFNDGKQINVKVLN